ncbi:unnamed protein product, partial [Allacma fusca]
SDFADFCLFPSEMLAEDDTRKNSLSACDPDGNNSDSFDHSTTNGENQAAWEFEGNEDILELDLQEIFDGTLPETFSLSPSGSVSSCGASTSSVGSASSQLEEAPGIDGVSHEPINNKKASRKRKAKKDLTSEERHRENERLRKYRKKKKNEMENLEGQVRELEAENLKLKTELEDLAGKLRIAMSDKTSWEQLFATQNEVNGDLFCQLLQIQENNRELRAKMQDCLLCSNTSAPAS